MIPALPDKAPPLTNAVRQIFQFNALVASLGKERGEGGRRKGGVGGERRKKVGGGKSGG